MQIASAAHWKPLRMIDGLPVSTSNTAPEIVDAETGEQLLMLHNDLATMVYPFFALGNQHLENRHPRVFRLGSTRIELTPSIRGFPTIRDKDILLYCMTRLKNHLDKGGAPTKTLIFRVEDMLRNITPPDKRVPRDGRTYTWVKDALRRLIGTTIYTNVPTGGRVITREFPIIEAYEVLQRDSGSTMPLKISLTLSDWCYRSLKHCETRPVTQRYLALRKPIERRIFELAASHCSSRRKWRVEIAWLHARTGSTGRLRDFQRELNRIENQQTLPEFTLFCDGSEVIFSRRQTS